MATAAINPPDRRMGRWLFVVLGLALLAAAGIAALMWSRGGGDAAPASSIEMQAERFVNLALTLGKLAPSEVDGYFGPEGPEPKDSDDLPSFAVLRDQVAQLNAVLSPVAGAPDLRRLRLAERSKRLMALLDRMNGSKPMSFDEEAQALYGLEPAALDEAKFAKARAELDRLLPGTGSLSARVEAFRSRYIVPEDLRPKLFERALAECRARTLSHWRLPASEKIDIEWTAAVPAAWHRYRGNFRSTLQINPQAVAFVGSIVDVACHEGYPGHHAQFAMAEAQAGKAGLAIEDKLVLLRSPASVIREGAADYAVSLALPPAARLSFERDVLFPMAGFPKEEAERFERTRQLIEVLAPAALPILRAYRDQKIDAEAAAEALEADALIASPQALLGFVDTVGAYVTGYTSVREQVRAIAEAPAAKTEGERWKRLLCLLLLADAAPLSRLAIAIDQGPGGAGEINPLMLAPLCGE